MIAREKRGRRSNLQKNGCFITDHAGRDERFRRRLLKRGVSVSPPLDKRPKTPWRVNDLLGVGGAIGDLQIRAKSSLFKPFWQGECPEAFVGKPEMFFPLDEEEIFGIFGIPCMPKITLFSREEFPCGGFGIVGCDGNFENFTVDHLITRLAKRHLLPCLDRVSKVGPQIVKNSGDNVSLILFDF